MDEHADELAGKGWAQVFRSQPCYNQVVIEPHRQGNVQAPCAHSSFAHEPLARYFNMRLDPCIKNTWMMVKKLDED